MARVGIKRGGRAKGHPRGQTEAECGRRIIKETLGSPYYPYFKSSGISTIFKPPLQKATLDQLLCFPKACQDMNKKSNENVTFHRRT
jgi:hypothetical protein